jgi:hypothetical protein
LLVQKIQKLSIQHGREKWRILRRFCEFACPAASLAMMPLLLPVWFFVATSSAWLWFNKRHVFPQDGEQRDQLFRKN